jgi:hypothetical protein
MLNINRYLKKIVFYENRHNNIPLFAFEITCNDNRVLYDILAFYPTARDQTIYLTNDFNIMLSDLGITKENFEHEFGIHFGHHLNDEPRSLSLSCKRELIKCSKLISNLTE